MAQKSWKVTVTTAGTAVQGPDTGAGIFLVQAAPANAGLYIYIGDDGAGDVSSANGYALAAGMQAVITTTNMNLYWFDAANSGDKADVLLQQGLPTPPY